MRVGPAISKEQAGEIVRQAALAPVEGDRKVLILHEFHLLDAVGAGRLLKTIEEPPASTHFVVLADFVPADLVTIASRCVRIEFSPIAEAVLTARLVAEGVDNEHAAEAAAAAGGNLDRARLLVADAEFAERRRAFAGVPAALNGTGSAVVSTVADLLGRIETAAAPLSARHAIELTQLDERERQLGTRGSGRAVIEARQKRELRRHRTDELRSGLAVIAAAYRDALVAGTAPHPDSVVAAVHRIHQAIEALDNNPNETLLLQALLWSLPPITAESISEGEGHSPSPSDPHGHCHGLWAEPLAEAADQLLAEAQLDLGLELGLVPRVPEVGVRGLDAARREREPVRADRRVVDGELQLRDRGGVRPRALTAVAVRHVGPVVVGVDVLAVPAVRERDEQARPDAVGALRRPRVPPAT